MPGSARTRPLLLGHRGARSLRSVPENSIESFERALADGCDGFEFDVRLTADGKAVVCHDPYYKGFEIATSSATKLPALPQLEDVISRFHPRAFLDIELKVEGLELVTLELLRPFRTEGRFVVSSFLPAVLHRLRVEDASLPLGFICETREELQSWKGVSCEYVIPHHTLLNRETVDMLQDAGKDIVAWTVNTTREMKKCRDFGVSGIISDKTRLLSKAFQR